MDIRRIELDVLAKENDVQALSTCGSRAARETVVFGPLIHSK